MATRSSRLAAGMIVGESRKRWDLTDTILYRLEKEYGVPHWMKRQNALDELISCILSQHTSDVNSFRAFAILKDRFPAWSEVMAAPVEAVVDAIRGGGLANSKAARIQQVLGVIQRQNGDLSLDFLSDMPDAPAREYLMSLPGVGPKTAAIVLCFALGRCVMPVDTHIFRVAWRIGLIEKRIGEARAHDALQAQVVPDHVYRFHVALITHGRLICKAPTPRCDACSLTDLCRFFRDAQRISA